MLTKIQQQVRNYEFKFSRIFSPILTSFTRPFCFVLFVFLYVIKSNLKIEDSYVISELVVGSGEQDRIMITCSIRSDNPEFFPANEFANFQRDVLCIVFFLLIFILKQKSVLVRSKQTAHTGQMQL